MSKIFTKVFMLFLVLCAAGGVRAQTIISGSVKDSSTQEPLMGANIQVKGKITGTISGSGGSFTLNVASAPPLTLIFSMVGYSNREIDISEAQVSGLEVVLKERTIVGEEVVVSASRVEESFMRSPVSIEKLDIMVIQDAPTASFYDALANVKGVDMSAQSLTFRSVNTRGFTANGNTRMVQLIDGIDNQAPGLNFAVGNIVGISELDLESIELLPGAASALYGANALNGILLMRSKSPFEYQGLSASAKYGITHADNRDHKASPYTDLAIRYAKAFDNKYAFKLNFSWLRAQDYQGTDYRDRNSAEIERQTNDYQTNRAANRAYDGVNVYGNAIIPMRSLLSLSPDLEAVSSLIPNESFSPRGFKEPDFVDNTTESMKVNAAFHYRINDDMEALVQGNWGRGSTVYTANDRFVLDNFNIWTAKAELRGANFYLRGYRTQENAGDSYAANTLGQLINARADWDANASNGPTNYVSTYIAAFAGARSGAATGQALNLEQSHALARGAADQAQNTFLSSPRYAAVRADLRARTLDKGGAKLLDKSGMTHFEGMYNLSSRIDAVDLIVGANFRRYDLNSEGTLFILDADGNEQSWSEYGAYAQASKSLAADKLKVTASLRWDGSDNFASQVTPRISMVYSPDVNSNFRASFQRGFRNPTAQDQFIDLDVVTRRLIGSNPLLRDNYHFDKNPVYHLRDVQAARQAESVENLKPYQFTDFKTEKVSTWEVGYKGQLFGQLFLDGYYYYSSYSDFIAEIILVQSTPSRSIPDDGPGNKADLINGGPTQEFGYDINADGRVTAHGWALGGDWSIGQGWHLAGNIAFNKLLSEDDLTAQGFRSSFNTPEYKTNLSISNRTLFDNFGFSAAVKWQDAYKWESAFSRIEGNVVPSFTTVDAQLSYKIPSIKSVLKLGATNLLNERYVTSFGNPSLGSVYYLSVSFDQFLN